MDTDDFSERISALHAAIHINIMTLGLPPMEIRVIGVHRESNTMFSEGCLPFGEAAGVQAKLERLVHERDTAAEKMAQSIIHKARCGSHGHN